MPAILDPEVRYLANLASSMQQDYSAEWSVWAGSPFAWIKQRPSRQIGTIGEKLVSGWLASKGFNVARSPDSDADRIIESMRVEIKFSTLWESGIYKFQQLRDQDYDFAILLGVSPWDAQCWVIEKNVLMHKWKVEWVIEGQHKGANGGDTAWISTPPSGLLWMQNYGGNLTDAASIIARLTGYIPTR